MCGDNEGYLTSDDWRDGCVKPLGRPWERVKFANVNGLAVFEGCILLGTTAEVEESRALLDLRVKTAPDLLTNPKTGTLGLAIRGRQFRWPNRTIPYEIDPAIADQDRIQKAIRHWEDRTTIAFVPRTTQSDYVFLRRVSSGCASYVGRRGGRQEMILSDGCSVGNIIHELGHAVGLWHEHSRSDRGRFVEIVYSSIEPARAPNFDQHIEDGIDSGVYDFGSIMHYPPSAFSADGNPTIVAKQPLPAGVTMGQRLALSDGDIRAVEAIYAEEPMPHGG